MFGFRRIADAEEKYAVMKTDAEWKRQLPPISYQVLRHEGCSL